MLDKNGPIYILDDRLVVAPLNDVDLIATAYLQMKREGTLALLYYEGDIGLQRFLSVMTNPACINYACLVKGADGGVDLAGIGHIAIPQVLPNGRKKAEISVAFHKQWQRRDITLPLAQMMVEWTFDRSDVDYLYGTTPAPNRAMLAFMRRLGFGHSAEPIPNYTCWQGEPCGVYVSWMDAERWKAVRPF